MPAAKRAAKGLTKAEQAARTRARIVAAATTLFLRDGFLATTVVAIAKEAGVAVQTLYLSFGNKTAILQAAFAEALAGDEEHIEVLAGLQGRVEAEPDGPTALREFLEATSGFVRCAGPLYAVMVRGSCDAEVFEVLHATQQARHATFTGIAEALASKPGFAPGLSSDDATGILYTVQSEESWHQLVVEHGWTGERWDDWVRDTLMGQLFPAGR